MGEVVAGVAIFACLAGAALASLMIYPHFPEHHRQDDTSAVVRLSANLFVVMSSLVLGLMINSAKNTFETIDHNVHNFATQLIILDRSLRQYGPDTADARATLTAYLQRLVDATSPTQRTPAVANRLSELLLNKVGDQLADLTPPEAKRAAALQAATQQLQKVIEQRWVLVGQSDGIIPVPLILLLVAWLMLIFASFGFRAPRNATIVGTFIVSGALASAALYLILDMDTPFTGPIQVSTTPLQRALTELTQ
ncbi:bestrophin-like domain [Mesorhizobium sp. ORM8.1]